MRELYDDIAPPGTFLVSAHPPRRAARLRRRRRHRADGWCRHRLHQGLRPERPDALVKVGRLRVRPTPRRRSPSSSSRRRCTIPEPSRSVTQTGMRWSVALADQPADRRRRRGRSLTSDSVFVVTGAAGSIVSAITADLAGVRRHVPPPRPRRRARPRRSRPRAVRHRPEGLKRDLAARIAARGERADAGAGRPRARSPRAARRPRPMRSQRSPRPAARRSGTRSTSPTATRSMRVMKTVLERPGRVDVLLHCAGAGDQPHPRRQAAARVRPRVRRQERRLVQPPARAWATSTRHRGRLQLDRRPLRQRWPDRLQRGQRPAVQVRVELPHHPPGQPVASPSTGRRGRASAWRAAARSRR